MIVGGWRPARVIEAVAATPTARVLRLKVPGWPGSEPGQHVDIRLTAEDGYQAVRSYSLGSCGPEEIIEIAVDEVPDGEVSPYLVQDVREGDELEVKGPLGAYFVWRPGGGAPVQLIAGGSGIVPLAAMVRARADAASAPPFRLLYSVRSPQDAIYRDLLQEQARHGGVDLTWAYTRSAPDGWTARIGRVDDAAIRDSVWPVSAAPEVFVCGPTSFVEHVADALVRLGHPPANIKTERFGGAR